MTRHTRHFNRRTSASRQRIDSPIDFAHHQHHLPRRELRSLLIGDEVELLERLAFLPDVTILTAHAERRCEIALILRNLAHATVQPDDRRPIVSLVRHLQRLSVEGRGLGALPRRVGHRAESRKETDLLAGEPRAAGQFKRARVAFPRSGRLAEVLLYPSDHRQELALQGRVIKTAGNGQTIGGGTQRVMKQFPYAIAMEILLTGDRFGTDLAERWGLVNAVVPRDKLMATAYDYARRVAENAPLAVQASKELAIRSLDMDLATGLRWESATNVMLRTTKDVKEGTKAFAEKRKPDFKGE